MPPPAMTRTGNSCNSPTSPPLWPGRAGPGPPCDVRLGGRFTLGPRAGARPSYSRQRRSHHRGPATAVLAGARRERPLRPSTARPRRPPGPSLSHLTWSLFSAGHRCRSSARARGHRPQPHRAAPRMRYQPTTRTTVSVRRSGACAGGWRCPPGWSGSRPGRRLAERPIARGRLQVWLGPAVAVRPTDR